MSKARDESSYGRRTRIFVVDDHPLVRVGLGQLVSEQPDLEMCGECESAEEALTLLEGLLPDVVVVDLSLKSGHGLTLIRDIRSRFKTVRILVYTMHDEGVFAERALLAGATGYVNKQTGTEELLAAIQKVAQGAFAVSPHIAETVLERAFEDRAVRRDDPIALLSNRELEVFELLGRGLTVRQIAERLHRSIKTVETHRERIMHKFHLNSASELMRRAVEWVIESDRGATGP